MQNKKSYCILKKEYSLSRRCTKPVLTLVMPISGGKVPNQLASAKHLLSCKYKPDIMFGTSGGAITGALLSACDMNSIVCQSTYQIFCDKLSAILKEMTSDWYSFPRSNFSFINTIIALGHGSLFERGNGANVIKQYSFSLKDQPELWIGTHCKNTATQQLFCTREKKNSIIKIKEAKYLDDDIDKIVQAVIASSAVPTIVPPVVIDDQILCDGGVSFASPLGPCSNVFTQNILSYHIVYISPTRYSDKEDPQDYEIEDDDLVNKMKSSTSGMVTDIHVADRNNGIRNVGPNAIKESGKGLKCLMRALKIQKKSERSFIEITPSDCVHVNFINMARGDIYDAVNEAYSSEIRVRHWYC